MRSHFERLFFEADDCLAWHERQARDDLFNEGEETMKSIGQQIRTIAGLIGTHDVSEETSDFITAVCDLTNNGIATTMLTSEQTERVDEIHKRHYGPTT